MICTRNGEQGVRPVPQGRKGGDEPFPLISRARAAMSKHDLIFLETRSVKSVMRLSTSEGRTERLCAVWRLDARRGLSFVTGTSRSV